MNWRIQLAERQRFIRATTAQVQQGGRLGLPVIPDTVVYRTQQERMKATREKLLSGVGKDHSPWRAHRAAQRLIDTGVVLTADAIRAELVRMRVA